MATDWELLDSYSAQADQSAFAELVRRHIDFVYSTARRSLGGPSQETDDVAQAVFLLLSQKARIIPRKGAITGWLFNATRYCCANVRKMQGRRRKHERAAGMMRQQVEKLAEDLQPVLDEGLAELGENQRQALLVRFMQNKTGAETGALLGISEEAAEKRMERGLTKLRQFFAKKGYVLPTGTVATVLAAQATHAAPVTLAAQISTGAGASGTVVMIAKGAAAMMMWTSAKTAGVLALVVALVAAGTILLAGPRASGANRTLIAASAAAPGTANIASTTAALDPGSVDAPALVRAVREKEKWIDTVASFHVKAELLGTQSQTSIDQRRAALKHDFPRLVPDATNSPDLQPQFTGTLEAAFDGQRVLLYNHLPSLSDRDEIFDGTTGVTHEEYHYPPHDPQQPRERYELEHDPRFLNNPLGNFAWPRAETHTFWWNDKKQMGFGSIFDAGDFSCVGTEVFEGVECYVLGQTKQPGNLERWYVGVKDGLLHKMEMARLSGDPGEHQLILDAAKKRHVEIKDDAALLKWVQALSPEEGKSITAAYRTRTYADVKAAIVLWMLDYKEIAPGCWYPMKQGLMVYGMHRQENHWPDPEDYVHPWISSRTDLKVLEVRINEKLPDELFAIKFKEGVTVHDTSDGPPG